MSSRLSEEIAHLTREAGRRNIRDHQILEKLTLIVGYGHLAETDTHCLSLLRTHLRAFIDLVCADGHFRLCKYSTKILEQMDGPDVNKAA